MILQSSYAACWIAVVCLVCAITGCASEKQASVKFESITYQKSGGIAGIRHQFSVDSGGIITVDEKRVAKLDDSFADLKRDVAAVPWSQVAGRRLTSNAADLFVYTLTYTAVQNEQAVSRTVVVDDMALTEVGEPLRTLIKSLENLDRSYR